MEKPSGVSEGFSISPLKSFLSVNFLEKSETRLHCIRAPIPL